MENSDEQRHHTDQRHFFAEVGCLTDEVFCSHRELPDHRSDFPWLTGCLGDPFADVWFIAENPSTNQVRRALGNSPELQWSVSRGDRLFREMLARHGFKLGGPFDPGGWRCYITDVIKSGAIAKEWNESPRPTQLLVAEAWAPVMRYELENGRPKFLVALGGKTEALLDHLCKRGLLPPLPRMKRIHHYSYIAMRPDKKRGLGPGDPQRIAEWDAEFAEIARIAGLTADG